MSQIPTPPASRPGSEAPEAVVKPADSADNSSELRRSLDTLLEQYLHLLDRQQQLQSGLSKELSSGFLALAHANYTCPPGRRYGSDYYDERMKATGRISINPTQEVTETETAKGSQDEPDSSDASDFEYDFSLHRVSNREPEDETDGKKEAKDETKDEESNSKDNVEDKVKQTPSTESASNTSPQDSGTPATPGETDPPKSEESTTDSSPKESKAMRKKFRSEDPIYWYGILVPPSLRTAQRSFTTATQSHIPELAGTVVEMRALEDRITSLRAKIEDKNT